MDIPEAVIHLPQECVSVLAGEEKEKWEETMPLMDKRTEAEGAWQKPEGPRSYSLNVSIYLFPVLSFVSWGHMFPFHSILYKWSSSFNIKMTWSACSFPGQGQ